MLIYLLKRTNDSLFVFRLFDIYFETKRRWSLHKIELFVQKVSTLSNISLYLSPNWF